MLAIITTLHLIVIAVSTRWCAALARPGTLRPSMVSSGSRSAFRAVQRRSTDDWTRAAALEGRGHGIRVNVSRMQALLGNADFFQALSPGCKWTKVSIPVLTMHADLRTGMIEKFVIKADGTTDEVRTFTAKRACSDGILELARVRGSTRTHRFSSGDWRCR
jgi:hypothetical protein